MAHSLSQQSKQENIHFVSILNSMVGLQMSYIASFTSKDMKLMQPGTILSRQSYLPLLLCAPLFSFLTLQPLRKAATWTSSIKKLARNIVNRERAQRPISGMSQGQFMGTKTTETIDKHIPMMTAFTCGVLIFIGFLQVWYLRRYFKVPYSWYETLTYSPLGKEMDRLNCI